MAIYPNAIPTNTDYPDRQDDIDWIYAERYNEIKNEVLAICQELGVTPKGPYSSVAERLADAIAKQVAGQINSLSEKTTLNDNDLLLIEDSEASYSKKKVKKSSLGLGGITQGWEKVSEVEVTTDTTYVDFTGLDGNTDWVYMLVVTIKGVGSSGYAVSLYANGDYSNSNYKMQYCNISGSGTSIGNVNQAGLVHIDGSVDAFGTAFISFSPRGYFTFISISVRRIPSYSDTKIHTVSRTVADTNLTSLRVQADVTGGIGAGSKFILMRLKRT